MNQNQLFTGINTSFNKQQNPLRTFEFPCDKEYEQMNIGSCSYFLLSEYPADIEVFVSLNPEFKDAFKVDNRNTGFKINDVYTKEGVPSFVKDVYIWTKGITGLIDTSTGKPKSVKIITSGIPSFEILNNSSINSIESIGQIGSINGLVGYPQGAITMTGVLEPLWVKNLVPTFFTADVWGIYKAQESKKISEDLISTSRDYIITAQLLLDPEICYPEPEMWRLGQASTMVAHTHAGIIIPENSPLPKTNNRMFPIGAKSFALGTTGFVPKGGTYASFGGGGIENSASMQFSGDYIKRNFTNKDGEIEFKVEVTVGIVGGEEGLPSRKTDTKVSYQISAYRTGV